MKIPFSPIRTISISGHFGSNIAAFVLSEINDIVSTTGDGKSPITIMLESTGGSMTGACAVIAVMNSAPMKINVQGLGIVGGTALLILAAATGSRSISGHTVLLNFLSRTQVSIDPLGLPNAITIESGMEYSDIEDLENYHNLVQLHISDHYADLLEVYTARTADEWNLGQSEIEIIVPEQALEFKLVDEVYALKRRSPQPEPEPVKQPSRKVGGSAKKR